MLRTVSDVAVAITSSSLQRGRTARQRFTSCAAYSGVNSSRPVDFGGGAAKYGCSSSSSTTSSTGLPARANVPSRSKCSSGRSSLTAMSITALPGPVSNARTASSFPPGGTTVTLPMPPMFCSARQ